MNRKLFSIGLVCLIALIFIPHSVHARIIEGPWLWMIAPTEPGLGWAAIDIDSLAVASGGTVTESDVAANGAKEGDKVGNYTWTPGMIFFNSSNYNNINECLDRIGLAAGDLNDHSCYALFTLRCEKAWNDITMQFYNTNVAIKVWLNGKVVHVDGDPSRFSLEYKFQVDFVAGDNLLMVKVSEFGSDVWDAVEGKWVAATEGLYNGGLGDGWNMVLTANRSAPPSEQIRRPKVRVVYFLPKDRQPQPDIDAKLDKLIKDTQQLFTDQMERHGYGRKTFQIETDLNGKAVVHHIVGQFTEAHYSNEPDLPFAVLSEVPNWFDFFEYYGDYYFTVVDMGSAGVKVVRRCSSCPIGVSGIGGAWSAFGGRALVTVATASLGTTAHELGHAFGLMHDFRGGAYIMSYSGEEDGLSKCAAEWLDVQRAFNPSINRSQFAVPTNSTVEMFPPTFAAPNAIRFRFRATTSTGLHQVQLHTPTVTPGAAYGSPELLSYKALNGSTDTTFELVTTDLSLKNKVVSLRMIDVFGNFILSQAFPIDLNSLLPPPQVVSIPDATLALAVRQALNLSSIQALTTHAMLDLKRLVVENSGITDLTGLEHAHNLRALYLTDNNISDVSPLKGMTKLTTLFLRENNISDVSPLKGMTQLATLILDDNNISDVSPLKGMTQLYYLYLIGNNISDISPLAGMAQLDTLALEDNNISDVSSLLKLNPTLIGLSSNPLSYTSINTHIPAMQAKGIEVLFDNVAHPALSIVSGNNQE
ncbi:MAG: leucine-rich repeat domain-containing protein, partial [Candidatus Poribacteria bacterium]|nr:leucine-rich repeat domain-containing protein [Candidatus Poribacteria bacterium]